MSKLYVCSLVYGCSDYALQSVRSLMESEIDESVTFFVLDNGSPNKEEIDRDVFQYARNRGEQIGKTVITHRNETNLGVSGGMNCLYRKAFEDPGCEWMVYTAQDVLVHPKGIQAMCNRAKRGDAHFITGSQVPWGQEMKEPHEMEGVGALFMGHFLQTRVMYETIGGWDEKFFPAYFEDNDYHARIIQGGFHSSAIGYCMAPVRHHNSTTIKKYPNLNANFAKNAAYFREKWGGGPAEVMQRLLEKHGNGVPFKHMKHGEIQDGIHPKSE